LTTTGTGTGAGAGAGTGTGAGAGAVPVALTPYRSSALPALSADSAYDLLLDITLCTVFYSTLFIQI
jgi:hypothetical protein